MLALRKVAILATYLDVVDIYGARNCAVQMLWLALPLLLVYTLYGLKQMMHESTTITLNIELSNHLVLSLKSHNH